MVRRQRQIGAVATLLIAGVWAFGLLDRAEMPTQDWRARWFGMFSPPPSEDLVIVGIDDQSLRTIQNWPWDRVHLADALREISRAGARVVALDVLLDEPQDPRPDSWTRTGEIIDGDRALVEVIRASGQDGSTGGSARTTFVLASRFRDPVRETDAAGADRKVPDPLKIEQIVREELSKLLAQGELDAATAAAPGLVPLAAERVLFEWSQVVDIEDPSSARRAILRAAATLRCSPVSALQQSRLGLAVPARAFLLPPVLAYRSAVTLADVSGDSFDGDGLLRRTSLLVRNAGVTWPALAPQAVASFLGGADASGVHVVDGSGGLRGGTLHQRTGRELSAWTRSEARVPAPLAMNSGRVAGKRSDALAFVTWPRAGSSWQGQFQSPDPGSVQQEISIGYVLEPKVLARSIRRNWIELGKLMEVARGYGFADESSPVETPARDLEWLDAANQQEVLGEREHAARRAVDAAKEFLELSAGVDPATISPRDATMLANCRDLVSGIPRLLDEVRAGIAARQRVRDDLAWLLGGKLVFVGWTATGAAADTVHTSIHPRTPGVYVHAAVANSMLTGFSRRFVPLWVDVLFIGVLGALGTLTATRAVVWASPVIACVLVGAWFLIAGIGLWDAAQLIVSVTGPSLAVGGSWLAVTMHRLLVEQQARRRTEEQFRSYVSPEVVDILVDNPSLGSVAPQRRELTVMMADLQGFTSLAERLGEEEIAGVLGEYLGEMTRVLLRHGATIDKYLGDGIMAFWGAPLQNPSHAADACLAALEMLETLDRLNAAHAFGGAGPLRLRIGLAAGQLMVGDFGCPPYRSSYTVLGDSANLCERLEGANKVLGTRLLVSSRVRELAGLTGHGMRAGLLAADLGRSRALEPGGTRSKVCEGAPASTPDRTSGSPTERFAPDAFVWRPVGWVRLRGRAGAEEVFELLGPKGGVGAVSDPVPPSGAAEGANTETMDPNARDVRMERRLTLTGQGVREYRDGLFGPARETFGYLITDCGDDPLSRRYVDSMAAWSSRIEGPITPEALSRAGFDGTIDLTDA